MTEALRQARESDHPAVVGAIRSWWAGSRGPQEARELTLLVPRLFLQHFASTCTVAERDGDFTGFLIGFHSHDRPRESYIHFVGVAPDARGRGLGRRMHLRFFGQCRSAGRSRIRAITSPANTGSTAFHRRTGFRLEPGDREQAGVPLHTDHDGRGGSRVRFVLDL